MAQESLSPSDRTHGAATAASILGGIRRPPLDRFQRILEKEPRSMVEDLLELSPDELRILAPQIAEDKIEDVLRFLGDNQECLGHIRTSRDGHARKLAATHSDRAVSTTGGGYSRMPLTHQARGALAARRKQEQQELQRQQLRA